jgi:hypothetical protein
MIPTRLALAAFALAAMSLGAAPARAAVVTVNFQARVTENGDAKFSIPGFAGLKRKRRRGCFRQPGAMPLSASSLTAASVFDRCASPMPRSTCGALVNWMFS